MWPNISSFNIRDDETGQAVSCPLTTLSWDRFLFEHAFPVSINPPVLHSHSFTHSLIQHRLYKPWDDHIITNAKHTAHTINKFKLMNLVTTHFYFCLLSKMKQIQWSYWNCFHKNPWHFQVTLSEQHTKYWEAIISFYGTVGADFFNFSTTQLCDVFIPYKWRHFAASLYLSFPLLKRQSLKQYIGNNRCTLVQTVKLHQLGVSKKSIWNRYMNFILSKPVR